MIVYNNQAPNNVNNVGQFGATEGSIGAYKQAAEYAADAKYWALLSQTKYNSVEDLLAEVERLYSQGLLLEEDIKQLKIDFEAQQQDLLGLIQSTNTAIDNTNSATELSKEATQEVLAQLDIISNMTVQTTLLPPGSMATGSYDNSTGVFSFGIPEGQPGRDGTDGTISDIGNVPVGKPATDDYGFYVDKIDGGLYRADMSDIANLVPSVRSVSINGGAEQMGAVAFNSVSSFNARTGDVVSQVGDYEVSQITGAASSGANSDITSLSGLTTALSVSQGGTGATTAEDSRTNLGLGSVSVEDIVPLTKGGTGATTAGAARTSLGLGLVSTESIVPITKGGTGATSAENARLALVAAKSGDNSDITSMTNSVTFTQPVSVADAVDATNAVNLGQISSDQGASLIGTLEGVPVQNIISNINTDIIQLKLNWAIENGYSDAGFTFTTGGTLTVDDRDKVVYDPVSKTWYSYAGALPVTVPAGFNPVGDADWKPQTDPNLRDDLASSNGADLIGYGQNTLSSYIEHISYFVTPEMFGAIGDGSYHPLSEKYATLTQAQSKYPFASSLSQSIDWAAWQAMLNTDSRYVKANGVYVVNYSLIRQSHISILGGVINMTDGAVFTIEGSISQVVGLSANITKTSRSVSFVNSPGLVEGDIFIVYNPTDYSWSPHRAYYRAGEFFKVHSVSGVNVNIYGTASSTYTAADVNVYKVDPVIVHLDGVEVNGESTLDASPLVVRFATSSTIKGFRGRRSNAYQLEINRCFGVDIFGGEAANNSPGTNEEYGLLISNSSSVSVNGGSYFATRHAIAIGGRNQVCAIPNRDITIIGAQLRNNNPDIGAADIHGNCDRIKYSACTILGSAMLAGRDISYSDCYITQRTGTSDGLCLSGSEIVGGTYRIHNCTLVTDGDLSNFGAVYLASTQKLKDKLNLTVSDTVITGGGGSSTAKMVQVYTAVGETLSTNVRVMGVTCALTTAQTFLYVRSSSGASTAVITDCLEVNSVNGPSGTYLIYPVGTWIESTNTIEMAQTGSVDIATTASGYIAGGTVSLRYPYSKMPVVTLGLSSQSGGAFMIPGVPPIPVVHTVTNAAVRSAIMAASSSFTPGTTIKVSFRTGINA